MSTLPDLRSHLAAAQDWVWTLTSAIATDQLPRPTPCSEFDVESLLAHMFGVAIRTRRYATHRDVGDSPFTVPLTTRDPAAVADQLRELAEEAARAWATWEVTDLTDQMVTGPFGTVPAGAAVALMASEHVVHGWDLAIATDQPSEATAGVVAPVLAIMREALPPAGARAEIPFGEPVASAEGAGPTEQLANWTGRTGPTR